ncbi:hypothetical protein Pcinc_043864, partial [Petrolisthes cinctipes]
LTCDSRGSPASVGITHRSGILTAATRGRSRNPLSGGGTLSHTVWLLSTTMTKRRPSSPVSEQARSRRRVRSSSVGDIFVHSVSEGNQVHQEHLHTGASQSLSDQQPTSACSTDTSWTNTNIFFQQPGRRQQVYEKEQFSHKPNSSREKQQMQQDVDVRLIMEHIHRLVSTPDPSLKPVTHADPPGHSTSMEFDPFNERLGRVGREVGEARDIHE